MMRTTTTSRSYVLAKRAERQEVLHSGLVEPAQLFVFFLSSAYIVLLRDLSYWLLILGDLRNPFFKSCPVPRGLLRNPMYEYNHLFYVRQSPPNVLREVMLSI
jgi:hypothetical protein